MEWTSSCLAKLSQEKWSIAFRFLRRGSAVTTKDRNSYNSWRKHQWNLGSLTGAGGKAREELTSPQRAQLCPLSGILWPYQQTLALLSQSFQPTSLASTSRRSSTAVVSSHSWVALKGFEKGGILIFRSVIHVPYKGSATNRSHHTFSTVGTSDSMSPLFHCSSHSTCYTLLPQAERTTRHTAYGDSYLWKARGSWQMAAYLLRTDHQLILSCSDVLVSSLSKETFLWFQITSSCLEFPL